MSAAVREAWGLPLQADKVPAALRAMRRWVCWVGVATKGRWDKVPKRVDRPRVGASVNDQDDWGSFEQAVQAYDKNPFVSGLGFVVSELEDLVAIDLDKCVKDGVLAPWAREIVESLDTYWEFSPSGTGVRGFALGKLPGASFLNRHAGVEMYGGDTARFLTITGHRLAHARADLCEVDELALYETHKRFFTGSNTRLGKVPDMPALPSNEECERIALRMQGKLTETFERFVVGAGDPGKYDSRSELIHGLCIALLARGEKEEDLLAALTAWEPTMQYALAHRKGDYERAFAFLWREVHAARLRVPVVDEEEFEDLTAGVPEAQGDAPRPRPRGLFSGAAWKGQPLVKPRWIIEDWIPRGDVTLYTGEGGLGKSQSMQQLQAALAAGMSWFGLPVEGRMRTLGVYCEDREDVLHWRQDAINAHYFLDYDDLEPALFLPRKGATSNALARFDRSGEAQLTQFYDWLTSMIALHRPDVVILDTLADVFDGDEINRNQVRAFMNLLAGLAMRNDCAVILCGHPSKAGQQSGDGTSGSTAWHNSARARMYLQREFEENLPTRFLTLSQKKSNYGGADGEVRLTFSREARVLVTMSEAPVEFAQNDVEEARDLFMQCLDGVLQRDGSVSDAKSGKYAPKLFAQSLLAGERAYKPTQADYERLQTRLEKAMFQLFEEGVITQERDLRNRTRRIVRLGPKT